MARWIKMPGPGEIRGEGDWIMVNEHDKRAVAYFEKCRETSYLPTREQDDEPEPDDV